MLYNLSRFDKDQKRNHDLEISIEIKNGYVLWAKIPLYGIYSKIYLKKNEYTMNIQSYSLQHCNRKKLETTQKSTHGVEKLWHIHVME